MQKNAPSKRFMRQIKNKSRPSLTHFHTKLVRLRLQQHTFLPADVAQLWLKVVINEFESVGGRAAPNATQTDRLVNGKMCLLPPLSWNVGKEVVHAAS